MKIQNNKIELKTLTFDEVFEKAANSEAFIEAYTYETLQLRLASEIRNMRVKKHLTQEGLAEQANMPQSVIARIESGRHTFSLATLDRIAHVLGKKVKLA